MLREIGVAVADDAPASAVKDILKSMAAEPARYSGRANAFLDLYEGERGTSCGKTVSL